MKSRCHDTTTALASNSYYFALIILQVQKNRSQMTLAVLTHLDAQVSKNKPEFKGPKRDMDPEPWDT